MIDIFAAARSRTLAWGLLIGLAPLVAGCADQAYAPSPPDQAAIARGQQIAQLHCAQCHEVGPVGDSRNPMAPPFRSIGLRYNHIGFEKRYAEMQAGEHFEMPGYDIPASDANDIAAYIDSYRRP